MSVLDQPTPKLAAPAHFDRITHFVGINADYWRLLIRGNFLVAITFGIFRFWLSTDMRRFLWSNTVIGGESLEYTGRGIELFLGFLIAIVVLLPLYVAFGVVPFLLPGLRPDIAQKVAVPLLFFVLALLGQFAIYRARRYRLTRTIFRGVRLHQSGSAWAYAFRSVGWWFLIFFTLGLVYPWAEANLESYKMRYTFYGDLPGHFVGRGSGLFARGIALWLVMLGPMFAVLFVAPFFDWSGLEAALVKLNVGGAHTKGEGVGVLAGAAVIWAALAAIMLYPAFQAMTMRWWLAGLRFGDIAIASSLRTGQVYRVWLRFLLGAVLFAIAAAVITALIPLSWSQIAKGAPLSNLMQIIATGFALLAYVVIVLAYSTIYQVIVKLSLWQIAVESIDISNFHMVELVKAEGQQSSPFGEGLADALNVGSF
jgi:uncharacterized membrane protein YjgN (DUF898 family)